MKLYKLERNKTVGLDETAGFIISAPNSTAARKIAAADDTFDESTWTNTKRSSCRQLHPGKKAGVEMKDFNAG